MRVSGLADTTGYSSAADRYDGTCVPSFFSSVILRLDRRTQGSKKKPAWKAGHPAWKAGHPANKPRRGHDGTGVPSLNMGNTGGAPICQTIHRRAVGYWVFAGMTEKGRVWRIHERCCSMQSAN